MKKSILFFCLFLIATLLVNFIVNQFPKRFDFTEDSRFTLGNGTKNLLQNVDSTIDVKVYLTGPNLPAGFKRLENAVKETLEEFKANTNQNLTYSFIDINNEYKDEKLRSNFLTSLAQKGIPPTNITDQSDGKKTQQIIAPGAIITYKGKENAVLLLKGNKMSAPQDVLNQSIEGLEFELAKAFKKLVITEKKKIGFFVNYSNIPAIKQFDLIKSLQQNYQLFPVDLDSSETLEGLDGIFVLKPTKPFTEEGKYKMDQFIVKGGKALFFLDQVEIDTLGLEGNFAKPTTINLEDLLFKYGARLNSDLVKDAQMSGVIPMNVGNIGNTPDIKMVPWPFFPIINNFNNSPIVKNLDAIYLKYVGTIDTVKAKGITKTPLLTTTKYTQVLKAPATISYNAAGKDFDANQYNQGEKAVAYLLEGKFESLYTNRILPVDKRYSTFKSSDKDSKIVIVADGDLPLNEINTKLKEPFPLGFDQYSGNTFGNKDFVSNAVDYLLDPNGVISARSKMVKLRPLDKIEITRNKGFWIGLNLIVPILFVLLLGAVMYFFRKKANQ